MSFVFDNVGYNKYSFYEAFGAGGVLLETGALGTDEGASVTLTASGITEIQFNNGEPATNSWWFKVDSIEFTPNGPVATPEPSTIVSAAIAGLMGIGYTWRRRKTKRAA